MHEGHVDITLAGASSTLAPSLGAAMDLCHRHQSFGALLAKLEAYDLPAAADVVHAGLGRSDGERNLTREQVFSEGLIEVTPLLIRFVIMLANGGRPLKPAEEEKPGGPFAG
ncbi:hypothetical protein V5F41_03295 [Xanthobacter autotrophicus]|uniref:hypothetical protein n=1 Tax=Xanthobacter autotrophicus TaxID=280 RepID=UPI003727F88C